MGEIINFQNGKRLMVNHSLNDFNEDESIKAQAILKKTKQTKKVNDPTRIILARNLGSILFNKKRMINRYLKRKRSNTHLVQCSNIFTY